MFLCVCARARAPGGVGLLEWDPTTDLKISSFFAMDLKVFGGAPPMSLCSHGGGKARMTWF